jgi:guanylate kinase
LGGRLKECGGGGVSLQDPEKKGGKGLVFVVSAPSGAGKTTLVKRVMEEVPGLRFSVSCTTRLPRSNERDGEDYQFVSPSVFQRMVEEGQFLEWAEVLGNRYGTPLTAIEQLQSGGVDLILDIDTQGARKVKEKVDSAVLVYIFPPSLKQLEERLVNRGLDSPHMIKFRLARAGKEIEEAHWYHYVIINEKVEEAVEKLKAIIVAERCREEKRIMFGEKEKRDGKNYGRGLLEESG